MTADYKPFRYNVSGRHSQTPLPLFTLAKLKDEPMLQQAVRKEAESVDLGGV